MSSTDSPTTAPVAGPLERVAVRGVDFDALHAEHLAETRSGLATLGFTVDDDLEATTSGAERRATRLTFTRARSSRGLGSVLVTTGYYGHSEVFGLPVRWGAGIPADEIVARLARVRRSRFLTAAPTNDEVRRFVALRDSLPSGSVDEVSDALADAWRLALVAVIARPERVEGHELRVALGLLADLASGVPVEWALRGLPADDRG